MSDARRMTDAEVAEARRVIAIQAATLPERNAAGVVDIGPGGAWARAEHVQGVGGRRAADYIDAPTGWPRK